MTSKQTNKALQAKGKAQSRVVRKKNIQQAEFEPESEEEEEEEEFEEESEEEVVSICSFSHHMCLRDLK